MRPDVFHRDTGRILLVSLMVGAFFCGCARPKRWTLLKPDSFVHVDVPLAIYSHDGAKATIYTIPRAKVSDKDCMVRLAAFQKFHSGQVVQVGRQTAVVYKTKSGNRTNTVLESVGAANISWINLESTSADPIEDLIASLTAQLNLPANDLGSAISSTSLETNRFFIPRIPSKSVDAVVKIGTLDQQRITLLPGWYDIEEAFGVPPGLWSGTLWRPDEKGYLDVSLFDRPPEFLRGLPAGRELDRVDKEGNRQSWVSLGGKAILFDEGKQGSNEPTFDRSAKNLIEFVKVHAKKGLLGS